MAQSLRPGLAKSASGLLRELCREQRTGVLYIATTNSLLAQFGLSEGEITFLSFQNKQGVEALEAFDLALRQDAGIGSTRFASNVHVPSSKGAMPPTEYILEQLASESARPPELGDPKSVRITEATRAIVEQELVELIGPMGTLLCDEVWGEFNSLDLILEALGRELPDPAQTGRFRQNVLKRLS
ncbi:MAG TPA: hypothetical protein PLP22_05890 [Candidatus Competibacter sp.]|nr:hypothetical protein [Candidatus Competibacteraceae bacterium]HRE54306.1 hypothetical protein [Candidatus Competibacter sp.]HUM94006.1 hypothetical protein [Candidatus Competibacter sp.]